MVSLFAVPVFFICFRETLETGIIVSVLLAFLKQTLGHDRDAQTHRKLVRQVWFGTALGLITCICIGAGFIGAFYGLGKDHWGSTENIWEGTFCIIASIVITWMGAALLRVSKLQSKWRVKLIKALEAKDSVKKQAGIWRRFSLWCEKYAMFWLPFITVLREGLEAVVFISGISLGFPATAFPLPVITGLACGCLIGFLIFKGGNFASIQVFLIVSTCFLYLIAAGLFSRAVWLLEQNTWNKTTGGDTAETGSGPGSYDIRQSVWHVNCCSPTVGGGGGWGIFNAILGWQSSATYGSVISYNLYWVVVICGFLLLRFNEKHGRWPLMKGEAVEKEDISSSSGDESDGTGPEKGFESKKEEIHVTNMQT